KNSEVDVVLTPAELEYLLEKKNSGNRSITQSKVKKITKSMTEGTYDYNYYAARIAVVDYRTGDILSMQHRAKAAILANVSLSLRLHYVNREEWLSRRDEVRTALEQATMKTRGKMPKEIAASINAAIGQLPHVIRGYSSTSGAAGSTKMTVDDAVTRYGNLATTAYNAIPVMYRDRKAFVNSIITLFIAGDIDLIDIKNMESPTSHVGCMYRRLLSEGYGQTGRNQLAYGIAAFWIAVNADDKVSRMDVELPEYENPVKYIFKDLI
ncbi:MAG: hypothetical protein ACRC9Y_15775, partial [Aeromonas veronii]